MTSEMAQIGTQELKCRCWIWRSHLTYIYNFKIPSIFIYNICINNNAHIFWWSEPDAQHHDFKHEGRGFMWCLDMFKHFVWHVTCMWMVPIVCKLFVGGCNKSVLLRTIQFESRLRFLEVIARTSPEVMWMYIFDMLKKYLLQLY